MGENERYLRRYGVDLDDEDNYDLIIDTSYSTVDDISNSILKCSDLYYQNKYFPKNWASPKIFLPLQPERETLGKASYSMDEMIESMKERGYDTSEPITAVEVKGTKGIVEGHHRNFAMACLGKTLIPYEVVAKDDEKIPYGGGTAKERLSCIQQRNLFDHEPLFEGQGKDKHFSYDDIYPGIYDRLNKRDEIESR